MADDSTAWAHFAELRKELAKESVREVSRGCSYCGSGSVRCEWPLKVCTGCGTVLDRVHFNAHKARMHDRFPRVSK